MRLGVDLGGTKTEIIALDEEGRTLLRRRAPTVPSYEGTLAAIEALVAEAEKELGASGSVGVAMPGTISKTTGLAKNANSVWLNGRALGRDLENLLGRPVRLANDANCFALSEAVDGAGQGAQVVFGVILGTGTGGSLVVNGQVVEGAHGIAGEWGHNSLPGMTAQEWSGIGPCYCGARGCIEQWLSGPGLAQDFQRATGLTWPADRIAASQEPEAKAALARWMERMGRALASVTNILDPDVIVLGGGLSNIEALYRDLSKLVECHAFMPEAPPRIAKNIHGDSSGVRGAAWLWPL